MTNYDEIHGIDGWFTPNECRELYRIVKDEISGPILEIGHFLGKSSACIAQALKDSIKCNKFISYDIGYDFASLYDCDTPYPVYLDALLAHCDGGNVSPTDIAVKNLDKLGLLEYATLIKGNFMKDDGIYDFIFCDAMHDITEIEANLPDIMRLSADGCLWAFHDTNEVCTDRINSIMKMSGAKWIGCVDSLGMFKFSQN